MKRSPFDSRPKIAPRKLNVLPENPDKNSSDRAVGPGRFPKWLHRPMPKGNALWETQKIVSGNRLPTVCEEAKCPNLFECWSRKTATFLAMGKECTRNCGFCDIDFSRAPKPLEVDEPSRLAESAKELGLKHVVITMVARDDLPDGGATHLAKILKEVRKLNPEVTLEVLTSDFSGDRTSLKTVLEAKPEIFNHNIETVRNLSSRVRHKATYERTLSILKQASEHTPHILTKSGFMVGLGETDEEVEATLQDLQKAGCQIVTIGQYLQPNRNKLRVKSFVTPELFEAYAAYGKSIGLKEVYAGPFVRSSYNAAAIFTQIQA
ncbi:MAG: Lipoyl synthase [Chlamydiae bacterium]|nr:Lipoyl synthase [Chlamydiota bacterium]